MFGPRPVEGFNRLRKNRQDCHPEEPQAVLSETKEGSPHLPDSTNAEILRFAQNDSASEFFRSLFKPLKLQGLKAPFEVLAIVGPEGPTPFLELTPSY
jgi:hypothetical protein